MRVSLSLFVSYNKQPYNTSLCTTNPSPNPKLKPII